MAASSSDVTIYGGGWSDSYTLFLYLSDVGHGDACVTLDPWYLRSANNVFANLDGNTDPTRYSPPCDTGAIGSAPNLDEHVQDILVDDNPVSKVREFRAGRNVVEWRVDSGRNVKRYVIEGRVAGGNWFFMEEDPYFVGHHSVAIPYPCVIDDVRLVEEEIGGKRILYYWDRLTSSVEGGAGTPRSEIHECAPPPMAPRESMMTMPETQRSAALSIVIVTSGTADVEVGNWMAVVDSMVVDYWEDIGHSISVLDVDTLAVGYSERRAAIKDDLEVRFLAGQLDAVHVIGDANDYVEFVGDQVSSFWDPELGWEGQRQALLASRYAGQATKDVVGTWAIADNYSGPFVNTAGDYPYILTDQPYVDFDGDWIAEVPITRWPARWTDELWLIAHQMQQYDAAVGMGQDDYDAYFFVGDDSASSGAFAAESYQEVVDEVVVPGYRTCWESSFQGHAAVVAGAIDFWNEHGDPNLQVAPPELVTIISRTSNANNLGGIFDGEGGAPLFAVEDLCVCGSQPPLWLAASCHGADFGTSESLLDGTPLCELLGLYGRAIGVIGPTMGSSQIANREVAKSVVGRLYEDPSRPMATSVFSALREVADGGYGSEYRIAVTLRSYCMIGNPVSRFSPGNYSVVGAPVATQPTVTESDVLLAWPNPSRSGTTIAVRSSDLDAVEIRIVDVSGRAIRTLRLDGATSKEVFWDHKDGRGLVVSPGVYWAHGKVRNRRVARAITVLR